MSLRTDGPTPNGGAYSIAIFYDANGMETDDKDAAVDIEVTEYAEDGTAIHRTYARGARPNPRAKENRQRIQQEIERYRSQMTSCPACGRPVPPQAKFCTACGAPATRA